LQFGIYAKLKHIRICYCSFQVFASGSISGSLRSVPQKPI